VAVSCEDFFDQESDHVMFVENQRLDNATDTIYSVTGILRKLQALADRTILLGEARADLVDVTDATSSDLRDVALFRVGDDNQYNQPRDYYAVINNCNYFLANADTTLRNSRNEEIFKREYAVVKAFRAWTYLQLAINYGNVPFYTEPILTKEEAESFENGHHQDITTICNWLINDLTPLASDLYLAENGEVPLYGDIGYKTPSRLFFFPIKLLLGELNLWAGNYRQAAEWYYRYITTRNGTNVAYPTGVNRVIWTNSSWNGINDSYASSLANETYNNNSELITMIPGDSIPYNGNYLQLRNIFNSFDPITSEYHEVSLQPSQGLVDISEAQTYTYYENNDTIYAPKDNIGWQSNQTGDLRLWSAFKSGNTTYNNTQVTTQTILKYSSRNAHIWRRQMVWLHFAEALNAAGYPRFAYQILARGLSNSVIRAYVLPYYRADSTWIQKFDFDDSDIYSGYHAMTVNNYTNGSTNMMGIHERGSGWAYLSKYYQMPDDTLITDSLQRIAYQQDKVGEMIADECALEFAFEGLRYYDLLRMAIQRNDPAFLADRIYARRGKDRADEMKSLIEKDLYQPRNWYLQWKGKIGY